MKTQVKLLPWPNPLKKENPYQKLMYIGLKANGVKILSTPPAFTFLRFVKKFDWLHLNWPSRIYDSKSTRKRQKKYEKFIEVLTLLKRKGVKIIWTMHNEMPHDAPDIEFHQAAYRNISELSDIIHVHFPDAYKLLIETYNVSPEKVHLMPHGVYGDYYGEKIPKAAARKQLGLPKDGIVILSFGELRWYKGIDKAVEAFSESFNESLQFLIAGKPADKKMADLLRASAEKDSRIILKTGRVEDEHVSLFFSAADIFMLSSNKFFTSGSTILALTYNLPIIGVPKNHLGIFEGKSFFCPWQPSSKEKLVRLMNNLKTWLKQVDYKELEEFKKHHDWKNLTKELSQRLIKLS